MGAGAARPRVSWMVGPTGVCGATGAEARPSGTNSQSSLAPPGSHWQGGPLVALRIGPVSARVCPVTGSATQRASPESRVWTNAIVRLSGDQLTKDSAAGVGTAMRRSDPSATRFRTRPVMGPGSWGPLVRGLMRLPARRSIGWASSAMVGMLRCSSSRSHWRSGLTFATGSGGMSRMSTMTCGGVL